MSAGQALGAVAGFFLGGPFGAAAGMAGAWQGMLVGGMVQNILDPPRGPHMEGPRLSDLTQQISGYGAAIPRSYGTFPIMGNVFWIENNRLKEVATTTSQGGGKGGGGGSATQTTYAYYGTFAVGLCEGPVLGVRRIWVGANLLYDAGSTDIGAIQASNQAATFFKLYPGTDTQLPDPRMQSTVGVANTPAYRGLAYLVFYDFPLASYGNSIAGAQVRVEVLKTGSYTHPKGEGTQVAVVSYPYANSFYDVCDDPVTNSVWFFSQGPAQLYKISKADHSVVIIPLPVTYPVQMVFHRNTNAVWVASGGNIAKVNIFSGAGTTYPIPGTYTADLVPDPDGNTLWVSTQGTYYSPDFRVSSIDAGSGLILKSFVFPSYVKFLFFDHSGNLWGVFMSYSGAVSIARLDESDGTLSNVLTLTELNANFAAIAYDSDLNNLWVSSWGPFPLLKINLSALSYETFYGWNYYYVPGIIYNPKTRTLWFVRGYYGYHIVEIDPVSGAILFDYSSSMSYPYCICLDAETNAVWSGSSSSAQLVQKVNCADYGITSAGATLSSIVSAEMLKSRLLTAGDIDTSLVTSTVRGFAVSSTGSIRSALDPLQGAFPFDVVQRGYVIRCVPRGTTSVATIAIAELDAKAAGNQPGVQLSRMREMDSVLPARLNIQYLDSDREYNIGEQYAERLNTAAVNVLTVNLPMVLTATEAAGKAEVLLYLYWLERFDVNFSLPPGYNGLEPADVVVINDHGTLHELRLTNINYTSGGWLECAAKYNKASLYTPVAVGATGTAGGVTLTSNSLTRYELLDIPLLQDSMDTPGFTLAMCGYLPGWPGGVLYRSEDAGQTWTPVQGCTRPGSSIGYAGTAIAAHDGHLIDKASVLAVTLISGALYSTTEAQMLAGANHFSYGSDGRWEIIAAQNCILQGDGSYRLTDLLRGRFGTEWASGLHIAGDKLVALDSSTLNFVTGNLNQIGTSRSWRGITLGQTLDTDSNQSWTYQGVNLECLSPVELNGNRNPASSDWALSWTRRTRIGGEWRDYVDASLGEAAENYAVEIWNAGYTTKKRTLSASTSAVSYSSAQQVADFGGNQGTLYLKIAQMSASVGTGYYLQQSITR